MIAKQLAIKVFAVSNESPCASKKLNLTDKLKK